MDRIEIDSFSQIKIDVHSIQDNKILVFKFSGKYRSGSEGNSDGLFMFSSVTSHYFVYEPITIILDLSSLEYTWGNTLLKSINFFNEVGRDEEEKNKGLIIVPSNMNKEKLVELTKMASPSKMIISDTFDKAINEAQEIVTEFLK